MVNNVHLDGRLADDAEAIKKRSDDTHLGIRFRLGYTPEEGGTGWIAVTAWGFPLNAELTKGAKVIVLGTLGFDSWEKDGAKRSAVTLTADDIKFQPRDRSADHD